MKEAFAKVNILPEDAKFESAVSMAVNVYVNSGGTNERGSKLLFAIAERLSESGQGSRVSDDQQNAAPLRQPVEGGEARGHAPQGHVITASPSSSTRDGGGQIDGASTGRFQVASPVREPSEQQRSIGARNAKILAITIMDSLKVDGRSMREWGIAEAERAGNAKTRDGYILRAAVASARSAFANLKGYEKLADVVPEEVFKRIKQKAEELVDAI